MLRSIFIHTLLIISFFFSFIFALTAGNFKRTDRDELILEYRSQINGSTNILSSEGLQHWIPPANRQKKVVHGNELDTILNSGNPYATVNSTTATTTTTNNTVTANKQIVDGIENALGPGQDPSPISRIESDGQRHYYFPTIDFGKGVYMQTSTDLNTVLSSPSNEHSIFNFSTNIGTEAPALYQWSDNNYLLYISSIGPAGKGYIYVLYNDGQDLLMGWQDLGPVRDINGNAIVNYDAFAFTHPNGNHYLLFSALNSVQIAQLEGFTQLGSSIATVIPMTQTPPPVIEAPGAIIQGNTLNVYYSENQYFTPQYNTLNIAISTNMDPLDEQNWNNNGVRSTVLQSNDQTGVYGTGSAGTFIGPNGQPWIAYTCFYNPNGFNESTSNPRRVQAQPLFFNGNDELIELTPDQPVRFM